MHDEICFRVAFNIHRDGSSCKNDDFGDAWIWEAMANNVLSDLAGGTSDDDFHGVDEFEVSCVDGFVWLLIGEERWW